MSDMNRKDFITLTLKLVGGAAAAGAALSACTFDGYVLSFEKNHAPPPDARGPDAPAGCGATDPITDVMMNHSHAPHVLVIPRADIATAIATQTTMPPYYIQGNANHDHTVTLTLEQFMMLASGGGNSDAGLGIVTVTSTPPLDTITYVHTHVCTASCA